MARRRSRPLLPHEIFPHLQSSQESTEDATSSTFSIGSSTHEPLPSSQSTLPSTQEYGDDFTTSQTGDQTVLLDKRADEVPSNQPQLGLPTISGQRPLGPEAFLGLSTQSPPEEPVVRVQHKSSRRATLFALYDEEQRAPNQPSTAPGLKRTTSLVRLSTTLDGEARIETGNESSPSPPRPHLEPSIRKPCARSGLQRSKSAIEPSEVHRLATTAGRSRDARTWTFYCDTDARDELTKQAEREQSGSAAGAIGLIRSHSNKVLTPNPNKRNAYTAKQEGMKRLKSDGKRVKTTDVSSSSTASSTAIKNSSSKTDARKLKPKSMSKAAAMNQDLEHGGDSDKENWEPGTQTAPRNRRHRAPANNNNTGNHSKSSAAHRRPVLGESVHVSSQSMSFDPFVDRENSGSGLNPKAWIGNRIRKQHGANGAAHQRENVETDAKAAEIMAGEAERKEDGKEDMDCVQGLLSLSQGAWC